MIYLLNKKYVLQLSIYIYLQILVQYIGFWNNTFNIKLLNRLVSLSMRHLSFTNVKTIVNLFQYFTNIIVLLLKHSIEGSELSVNQGAHFNLTCFQSSTLDFHGLILSVIDKGELTHCLVDCNQKNDTQCTRLRLGTSDIFCGSGPNCYLEPQCNFTFKSASILQDGLRVGCVDFDVIVEEWKIKGSIFLRFIYN